MPDLTKILVIDIGNSYTKLACFVDGTLEAIEAFPTENEELSLLQEDLEAILKSSDQPDAIQGAVISTVVPHMKPLFERLLHQAYAIPNVLWIQRETLGEIDLGPINLSPYAPGQLGTDRVANIVGAHHRFPGQMVVVCDAGTSTTFDMVDENGVFIGGAICPGPLKFQSLVDAGHAAQLFQVDVFQKPRETPGQSTQACLENGLYYGYKGAILEIAGNILQQARWPLSHVRFVFTGGYGRQIRDMLTLEIPQAEVMPDITLAGLYHLWEINQKTGLAV